MKCVDIRKMWLYNICVTPKAVYESVLQMCATVVVYLNMKRDT